MGDVIKHLVDGFTLGGGGDGQRKAEDTQTSQGYSRRKLDSLDGLSFLEQQVAMPAKSAMSER